MSISKLLNATRTSALQTIINNELTKKKDNVPVNVYRVYNPNSGKHHYTTSSNEKMLSLKAGWRNEGTSWYAPNNKTQTPVYRVYNPHSGEHHYTISTNERNVLIKTGWDNENIAWYAV